MSDDHDWVRRLLAEEGQVSEPVPPEVARRLDRVLADLAADAPDSGSGEPSALPMTPRRHRRWAAGLLAAAAVTVGGYSVTATGLLDGVTGGGGGQAASDAAGGDSSVSGAGPKAPEADAGDTASTALPSLSSQTIRRDAAELAREVAPAPPELRAESEGTSTQGFGAGATEDRTAPQPGGDPATAECRRPPGRIPGRRLAVTFDASAATAVVHPRDAGRVLVQVWSCDGPVLLARVLVPTVER